MDGLAHTLPAQGAYHGGHFEESVAERDLIERVFQLLPHTYATCLWLRAREGFSYAEIAGMLNISVPAVRMRVKRARERFISLYRQEIGGNA